MESYQDGHSCSSKPMLVKCKLWRASRKKGVPSKLATPAWRWEADSCSRHFTGTCYGHGRGLLAASGQGTTYQLHKAVIGRCMNARLEQGVTAYCHLQEPREADSKEHGGQP